MLLNCVLAALAVMSVTLVASDLVDPSSIVEMEGWGLFFPPDFNSTARINLPKAATGKICLSNCFLSESGCRMVTFNLDSRSCVGYKAHVEGTFVNSPSSSLLAISRKKFYSAPGFVTDSGDPTVNNVNTNRGNLIFGVDGRKVANNQRILSEEICVNLCRIHPKCKTAYYGINDCGLTTGSGADKIVALSGWKAFVSW